MFEGRSQHVKDLAKVKEFRRTFENMKPALCFRNFRLHIANNQICGTALNLHTSLLLHCKQELLLIDLNTEEIFMLLN